jgi:glycosyltransferase involved in cell wall biosynthesis
MIKLSICMATFKRADFIAETLDSIVPSLSNTVELVIVDGASPDNTAEVVASYVAENPHIRYFREGENSGVDADYDKAVGYARGRWCWLMPDDDLVVPNAVARVLELLAQDPDLIVVDAEVRDVTMQRLIAPRRMNFTGVRTYSADDLDALMGDVGEAISFIGAVIIRRDIWLSRERERYHGSLFAHVGVIFQAPLCHVIALGESLIRIRYGNSMWTPRSFEIWALKWPNLIWSMPGFSDATKERLAAHQMWTSLPRLFAFRAKGSYSYDEYRAFLQDRAHGWRRGLLLIMAIFPGRLAHVIGTVYFALRGQLNGMGGYDLLYRSRFSNPVSRWVASRVIRRGETET